MNSAESWWQTAEPGSVLSLGFVKLDRVGSTREWDRLPEDEVRRRRQRYTSGIEHVARAVNAALPLHFQGDPTEDDAQIAERVEVVKDAIRDLIVTARNARRGWFR